VNISPSEQKALRQEVEVRVPGKANTTKGVSRIAARAGSRIAARARAGTRIAAKARAVTRIAARAVTAAVAL
jgi:hypothetical protein